MEEGIEKSDTEMEGRGRRGGWLVKRCCDLNKFDGTIEGMNLFNFHGRPFCTAYHIKVIHNHVTLQHLVGPM